MASPPIPECPEVHSVVTTEIGVHLVLLIEGDWEAQREAAVAELERKTQAATAFAAAPAFKARYGERIGVLRVQSRAQPPSIVAHLLSEQGIELEHLVPADGVESAAATEPERCSFCGRDRLPVEKALMTDSGWACPSCFRVWNLKNEPQLGQKPRSLRLPPRFIIPLIVGLAVIFAVFAYYELTRLNGMNQIIRQHMPRE